MSDDQKPTPKKSKMPRGGIPGAIRDDKIIDALLSDEPIPDTQGAPATVSEYVRQALKALAYNQCAVETAFASNAVIEYFPEDHPVFTTAAVYLDGEGTIRLGFNIDFVKRNPPIVLQFAILHEMHHLWLAHLYDRNETAAKEDFELWVQAEEAIVNDRCSKIVRGTENSTLPGLLKTMSPNFRQVEIKDFIPNMVGKNGQETSPIRPMNMYRALKDVCIEAGLAVPTYEEFVISDLACYAYLKEARAAFQKMSPQQQKQISGQAESNSGEGGSADPSNSSSENGDGNDKDFSWLHDPGSNSSCAHASGRIPKDGEDGSTQGMIDPSMANDKVEQILTDLIQEAINGNQTVRDALDRFFDDTLGDESPIWGRIPMDLIRSHPTTEHKVTWWLNFLMHTLTSMLVDGERIAVNRKTVSWSETPLQPIGKEEQRLGAIFIDTSGSMSSQVLKKLSTFVGSIPDTEVKWFNFDADVVPLEVGDAFAGGGGTDFGVIEEKVKQLDQEGDTPLDFVIVVTDGYAPPIEPNDPAKWIWLITPGGHNWPANYSMRSTIIDELGN